MLTDDRRCTWTERDWRWRDASVWLSASFSKLSTGLQWRLPNALLICPDKKLPALWKKKIKKNTQLATKTALSTFKAFCGEKYPDKDQDFDEISKEKLNKLLVDFYPNARKKIGGNYKKTGLTSIRFGLQRYFILKRGFNIIADDAFKQSNQVFEAVVVQLKRQGFVKVDHHKPIKKEDLAKIFSSFDQSSPNPTDCKSMQHFVWFNIMYQLIRRGRENLHLHTK